MQPVPPVQIRLGQRQWVEKCLQNMALSPSTLSNFLRCPVSFYYECILRVPQQGAPHFAFGSAVHYALETAFLEMRRRGGWPDKETILAAFERAMYSEREAMLPQEFRRRLEHGRNLLSDYYDERLTTLYRDVEIEYKVSRVMLDGVVPVTGRIDKIEKYPDGVVVVDYKTGKAANAAKKINPPSEDEPLGGDYWRQMVFYKILLEGQPERRWDVKYGFFDLLEKGDRGHYEPKTVPMFEQDVAIVKGQIRDAWGRIQNGDFDTGCGKEECSWCGFARRHELIRPVEDTIILR
jgi:DNA helicase-2/ATP-dependent DNA helicase PcrA